MGFAHELQFTVEERNLNNKALAGTEKVVSVLWFVAYALFLCAVIFFLLYSPLWWIYAAAGVVVSQILIILDWHEAKYGTITNIIILLVIIPFLLQL